MNQENPASSENFAHGDGSNQLGASERKVDFLHDVPLEITVELGACRMPLSEILALGPNSVIELNKANGAPLDIKINGVLVARGEAVVIQDRFGVRLTQILGTAQFLDGVKA